MTVRPALSWGWLSLLLIFSSLPAAAADRPPADSVVVTNTAPLMPFTVNIGQGKYPDLAELQRLIREKTARLIAFNAAALAKDAGNVLAVNMVLLGALVQTGVLPFSADQVKEAMKRKTKPEFLDTNLKAFDMGYDTAAKAA